MSSEAAKTVRLAELVGALALGSDLGTGQPLEHALRSAVLAVRLGELLDADEGVRTHAFYAALLHSSGCTSDAHELAAEYGDDIAPRAEFAVVDVARPTEILAFLRGRVGLGANPVRRLHRSGRRCSTLSPGRVRGSPRSSSSADAPPSPISST